MAGKSIRKRSSEESISFLLMDLGTYFEDLCLLGAKQSIWEMEKAHQLFTNKNRVFSEYGLVKTVLLNHGLYLSTTSKTIHYSWPGKQNLAGILNSVIFMQSQTQATKLMT